MKQFFKIPDLMHPTENVERARRYQRFRISCGIRVRDAFDLVEGMLIVSNTCGRWLKPHVYRTVRVDIPDVLRKLCIETTEKNDSVSLGQIKSITNDLAGLQAHAISLLLSGSVKVLENVLAVAVTDPGIWFTEFDGVAVYQSLCDPQRLAELTGLSVIDAFPARDVAGGGNGGPLSLLPYWLMFSDRSQPAAEVNRALLNFDSIGELVLLPASDGFDAELPAFAYRSIVGNGFLSQLMERYSDQSFPHDPTGDEAATGKCDDKILGILQRHLTIPFALGDRDRIRHDRSQQSRLVSSIVDDLKSLDFSHNDLLCTINHYLSKLIVRQLKRWNKRLVHSNNRPITELVLAGTATDNLFLQNLIRDRIPSIEFKESEDFEIARNDLGLATAGLLGLMHIDQFPANVPAITGTMNPRILGRLTPGSPSNWRHLITEMTDYRPPAMKLRDAV